MDTINVHLELVAALERRGKTRQAGDLLEFCCPRHDDTHPSAWLGEWRWGCHSCGIEERLDTLCAELGVDPPTWGLTVEQYADAKGFTLDKLRKWGLETTIGPKGGDVVAMPCRDENGKLLRRRLRGNSGVFWEGKNLPPHLYGLEMLAKAPSDKPVILVEGESDCHACWHHRRLAVGVPGANGWKKEWSPTFTDRDVYVWQEPGLAGEQFVAKVCRDLPNAKVIRANGCKDLADLHKDGDFEATLDKLMATASEYVSTEPSVAVEKPSPNGDRAPVITCLANVEPERVTWLWKGRIPFGKITLLEGDPGTGKTTVALDMAARISTGRPMPDGGPTKPAAVLFLTGEDGLADTIRPRLDAMGGDPSRVYSLAIREPDGFTRGVTIPGDLSYVRDVIERHGIVLVVVDPLNAFLADYIDTHKDHGIRRAMAPLAQLAEETGAAIVPIRHLNKSGHGKAMYRGGGSIAFAAAARSVLLVAEDPEDDAYRVLAPVKHNLTAPPTSLRFHLDVDLEGATRIIWDGESSHSANALCAQPTDPEERNAARELADFLKDLLEGAPRTVKEIQNAVRGAGFDVCPKTLQRARRRIGADAQRSGFGGEVVWSLPAHSGHIPDTHEGVSSMVAKPPETPANTPGPHSGQPHSGHDPMSSMEDADYVRIEREGMQEVGN